MKLQSRLFHVFKSGCHLLNRPSVPGHLYWASGGMESGRRIVVHETHRLYSAARVAENYVKLKSRALSVNPGFGVLHANSTINFLVKPTNPQEYPDADQAFVNVYGLPSTPCKDINIELTGELQDTLTINATPESSEMYCEVLVPIKYDLDISLLEKACIEISGMEADDVKVSTKEGEIKTKGLKSHNIHITTEEGNITSEGSMQGNIFIKARKTHLTAKRLQGLVIDIEADELTTAVESSYMNQGQISAKRGDVKINSLHGCTDLLVKEGQIVLRGFHGQISAFVRTGKIDAQVTDVTGNSTLHVNSGEMTLSIIDTPRHGLEVSAPTLEVSDEVQALGSTANTSASTTTTTTTSSTAPSPRASPVFSLTQNDTPDINILKASVTNGVAEVKSQSWFSTLGIKMERED